LTSSPVIDISPNLRLLGTAHVAKASVEAVKYQIDEFKPEVVAVELCKSRHDSLVSGKRLDKEGLLKVIKQGKAPLVLLQSMLASEQRKLGLDEGEQPGAELLAAVETAKENNLEVELIDRDIQVTLRRAWKKMKFTEKFRILYSMLGEDDEDEDKLELDQLLGDRDLLSSMMEELREFSPGAGVVLIDERDSYLAEKIRSIDASKKTLVVVGAGHLSGLERLLKTDEEYSEDRIKELEQIPKKSRISKIIPWMIPALVMGLMVYFLTTGDGVDLVELFTVWTVANAVLAAIGCILARGHILAILTAALASPITSLNPTLAAGWFAGYVQMKVVEPTTEDLQNFLKLDKFSMFWTNRSGRVLLVTALTNVGSMAGAWVAAAGLIGGI
jgi:pheromone shutdown-related protein TraB